jgi:hypothetical protein
MDSISKHVFVGCCDSCPLTDGFYTRARRLTEKTHRRDNIEPQNKISVLTKLNISGNKNEAYFSSFERTAVSFQPRLAQLATHFTMGAFSNIQTRQDIFDSATRIKQATQEPSDFLMEILVQQQQFACIEWLWHFKVIGEVPLRPDSISYANIATKLKVPESTLRAVARMAMTANFLSETAEGRLAHNSLSETFVKDDGLATWLSYMINRSVPCMRALTEATRRWPEPEKGSETAYNVAMDTELSFFDHLKSDQDLGAEFGKYMKSQSNVHAGASVDHLVVGLDWAALGNAKIVDVRDAQILQAYII